MQISSKEFFRSQLTGMSDLQSRIGRLQEEVSTGKKLLQPSDDPSGYVKVQSLKQSEAAFEQYDRNIGVANQRLSQEDTVLGQVVISTTRLQELAIAGANGTNDPSARQAIIAEMEQISDQIATLANSVDSNGDFIFAGYQSRTKPFEKQTDGSISYLGDSGRREVEIAKGVTTATSSSGREVFMQVSQPDGLPSASIFSIIKSAIDTLKLGDSPNPTTQANINKARTEAVSKMKSAMEHFSTYQTICGSRLQKVESVQQIGQSAITSSKTMRSTIEDSKIEEVATELSQKSLNLTASQTTFAKIAQLSLFNFLR